MNNRRNELLLVSAREYCKCVVEGKTIKYNQYFDIDTNMDFSYGTQYNGITLTKQNGRIVINGTSTSSCNFVFNIPNVVKGGHKYFRINLKSNGLGMYSEYEIDDTSVVTAESDNNYLTLTIKSGKTFNNYVFNGMFIDLTELGLDNINSVADFYATDLGKYIRKGNYLETTSGAFIQAKTPINFKGVNIWNEKTTLVSSHLESENINCLPNKNYYFSCSREGFAVIGTIYWYDKNGTQLDYNDFYERNIVSPSNSAYFKLVFNSTYGTTYNHDICISENAWDENYTNGYYNSSGDLVSANNQLCTANKLRVLPNSTYLYAIPSQYQNLGNICFYDKNGNFIARIDTSARFTTPNNCYYINISFGYEYGTTYNNDIAIFYVGYQKYCGRTGKVFVIDYNQQIKNGNFATTDDWTCSGGTMSVLNNELTITITERSSQNNLSTNIKLNTGNDYHKLYVSFDLVQDLGDNGSLIFGSPVNDRINDIPCGYTVTRHRYIKAINNANGTIPISLYFCNYANLSVGQNVKVSNFMIIDLTEIYGVGNEPSTVSDFNNTDLGQLIAEKGYLPYSQRNVGYALGKQLQKGDYYKTYGVDKVSYNQLVQNGNFQDTSNWTSENGTMQANVGSLTYEITTVGSDFASNRIEQALSHTTGHKYFVIVDILCPYSTTINLYVGSWETLGTAQENTKTTLTKIYTASSTGNNNLYFDIHGQPSYSVGDKITVYKYMKIDLTALGLGDIATLEEFYRTPLGMLVKKGFYLNYTTSNKTIKPQLIRTMKEIDMEDLNWQSDEIGMYAPLPSDCKKFNGDEMANILAENYKTAPLYDYEQDTIAIGETSLGWVFLIRYNYDTPTGKLMYELNTPIIVDEEIEDIMVSRRTIGVESDNGVDLDFTKE